MINARAEDFDETRHARWVIGVDGSESSRHAALWAAAHARTRTDELNLCATWAIPSIAAVDPAGAVMTSGAFDSLEQSATATVDELTQRLGSIHDVAVTQTVARGSAAALLLDVAASSELLVVGSRGRGGFARLLLGSTSTQCATHAVVPVVVVPATAPIGPALSMLVAFDGSPNSVAALLWAAEFAAPGSVIDCVSVWDAAPDSVAEGLFFPEAIDIARQRLGDDFAKALVEVDRADVRIEHVVVEGRTRTVLSDRAKAADLVVMGARGHGALGAAILGSVSTWLLHRLERPMVVVPAPDDAED